ncbi:flagellar filament capping protein FliD [Cohnella panacarvi]|uniref:flagellar filament capping protein FliD n=1 Tax=Cohnella panacarvi TaxID=400776 RepID=UPI0004790D05|nr:flagellar filament capping protein FliD [Cohnella panacarvi]
MVMRISGFSSGLDIDSIVKNLLKAQRAPLDKLNQQKTALEWQREQYRDVNIKMVDFRNNKLFNYGLQGTVSAKQVKTSGNTSAVSAKADSNAIAGSMTIEVKQLATSSSIVSTAGVGTVDKNKTLNQLNGGALNYTAVGGKVAVTINGQTIQLDETIDTLNTMVAKINANKDMNVTAFIDGTTGKLSLTSKTGGPVPITTGGTLLDDFQLGGLTSSSGIGAVDTAVDTLADLKTSGKLSYTADGLGNVSFSMNGSMITVNENDTLNDLLNAINSDAGAAVTAAIDGTTGKLTIKSDGSGSVAVSGDLFAKFNLTGETVGQNAKVVINGIETERASNTFTENGVSITLNTISAGSITTLNVTSDTDKIVDSIKTFIKEYNDLLETVNNKVNEERYRKFSPLTSEQKAEMSEDEIKLWEDKAKSGLLRRDTTLTTMVDNMRLAAMTDITIDGVRVNLASFGIETGEWQQRGKLVIKDEAKLRQAIEANPAQVEQFFTQQTTQTDAKLKVSPTNPDNGLFNRLSNTLMTAIEDLSKKAGTSKYSISKDAAFLETSSISELLRSLDTKIYNANDRLNRLEVTYYKQFTAMETAMNRFQSQSSALFGSN